MFCHLFLHVGSFIFLAIEGGASQMQQRTLASTNRQQLKPAQSSNTNNNINGPNSHSYNVTLSPAAMQDVVEVRDRCVENIWDVTVSLNVLYRENWTRYAWDYFLPLHNLWNFLLQFLCSQFSACYSFLCSKFEWKNLEYIFFCEYCMTQKPLEKFIKFVLNMMSFVLMKQGSIDVARM